MKTISSPEKLTGKEEAVDTLNEAFLNSIAHEIRTSLNGVLGFASLLVDPDISDEEKQAFLEILNSTGGHLIQKATDILDISQIIKKSLKIHKTKVAPEQLIEELHEKYQSASLRKKIELTEDIQPEIRDLMVTTDRELLGKLLGHLLDNSLKFTKTGEICTRIHYQGDSMIFSIRDTGIGINPQAIATVFDTFHPEKLSDPLVNRHTGHGLFIVKGISEILGGKVWVESMPGEGSTFFFSLPCEKPAVKEIPIPEAQSAKQSESRPVILIAEDELYNFMYLEIMLRVDYTLLKAEDGEKAIDMCWNHPEISLVLMDIRMPRISGLEAVREIRKFRPDLPIIALTAYAQTGDEERCYEAGCDDYLSKPVGKKSLLTKLRKFGLGPSEYNIAE